MEPSGESSVEILSVQPLKLFNKQKMLTELWDLRQANILGFFNEINNDKRKYGISDAEVIRVFPDVVNRITTIVHTGHGSIFLDPTMVLPFLDVTLEVRNLYDLVGWIFSVASGKTDKQADRNNYYLPLICVYCVFCRRLTENRTIQAQVANAVVREPMDFDPTMTQITWFNNPVDNVTYFCLSANLGCWTAASRAAFGRGKQTVRHNRGEQLKQVGILAQTVNIDAPPPQGQGTNWYGSCAETVPFLFVKSIMKRKTTVPFKRELVGGLAFEGYKFLPIQAGDPVEKYDSDKIKQTEGCREPCLTCSTLIKSDPLHFPIENFKNIF